MVVDAFLLALTWVVQLIVYPGFRCVDAAANEQWHRAYTARIVVLTMPTMVAQLALHGIIALNGGVWAWLAFAGVLITWGLTFGRAVQLHQQIGSRGPLPELIDRLIRVHSFRTVAWTLVFLIQIKRLWYDF